MLNPSVARFSKVYGLDLLVTEGIDELADWLIKDSVIECVPNGSCKALIVWPIPSYRDE